MKKYTLTDEHRALLPAHTKKWIANAMSTAAMTETDRELCRAAVTGMYAAANLPPPKHIVFVPSPLVLRFAGGFAAAIWNRHHAAPRDATDAATRDATDAATRDATYDATRDLSKWYTFDDMAKLAEQIGVGEFGMKCAQNSWRMWSGGNQYSYWDSFLSFFQDVAKLDIDYTAYNHWRTLSEHSGPRIVHPDFCMISDRPTILKVDDDNRPHAENGPFCQWRDGSALYSWHGVRIPASWVEVAKPTAAEALAVVDLEQRRAACEIVGWHNILDQLEAKTIDTDPDPEVGELVEVTIPDVGKERFLRVRCGTGRDFALAVPPTMKTALEANCWTYNIPADVFNQREVRT